MQAAAKAQPLKAIVSLTSRRAASTDRRRRQAVLQSPHDRVSTTFHFTVAQYYQLRTMGIIAPDQRTELIDGEITMLPPTDPIHASTSDRAQEVTQKKVPSAIRVLSEKPIHLGDTSEPVPDVIIVRRQDYSKQHPTPARVFHLRPGPLDFAV